jgi:hypothetical protein
MINSVLGVEWAVETILNGAALLSNRQISSASSD